MHKKNGLEHFTSLNIRKSISTLDIWSRSYVHISHNNLYNKMTYKKTKKTQKCYRHAKHASKNALEHFTSLNIRKSIAILEILARSYVCIAQNSLYNKNAYKNNIEVLGTSRLCIVKCIKVFCGPLDWGNSSFLKVMEHKSFSHLVGNILFSSSFFHSSLASIIHSGWRIEIAYSNDSTSSSFLESAFGMIKSEDILVQV